jgi:hypothetical protein
VAKINNEAQNLEKALKQEQQAKDAAKAVAQYAADAKAVLEKTARLRALRLAKEAADRVEETAKAVKPVARKRMARSTS